MASQAYRRRPSAQERYAWHRFYETVPFTECFCVQDLFYEDESVLYIDML